MDNTGQTHFESLIESGSNMLVGFLISFGATFLIYPIFGIATTPYDNFGITVCFTIVTFLRTYTLRRFFNK